MLVLGVCLYEGVLGRNTLVALREKESWMGVNGAIMIEEYDSQVNSSWFGCGSREMYCCWVQVKEM